MDRSIESRCKIIDSRIEKVEDKCDKSLAKLLQLNNLLVEWKNDVDDCFKSNERRLCHTEKFISDFKHAWSKGGHAQFWQNK